MKSVQSMKIVQSMKSVQNMNSAQYMCCTATTLHLLNLTLHDVQRKRLHSVRPYIYEEQWKVKHNKAM